VWGKPCCACPLALSPTFDSVVSKLPVVVTRAAPTNITIYAHALTCAPRWCPSSLWRSRRRTRSCSCCPWSCASSTTPPPNAAPPWRVHCARCWGRCRQRSMTSLPTTAGRYRRRGGEGEQHFGKRGYKATLCAARLQTEVVCVRTHAGVCFGVFVFGEEEWVEGGWQHTSAVSMLLRGACT